MIACPPSIGKNSTLKARTDPARASSDGLVAVLDAVDEEPADEDVVADRREAGEVPDDPVPVVAPVDQHGDVVVGGIGSDPERNFSPT